MQTMESGTLARWVMTEGSEMAPGDVIAEVQTDKAAVDFESQDDGYLARILVADGTEGIACGSVLGVIVEDEADIAAFKDVRLHPRLHQHQRPKPRQQLHPALLLQLTCHLSHSLNGAAVR